MAESLLNSWKDIAAHLHTSVRTAQRWEMTMRLPVHRPGNGKKGPILAFTGELDEWLKSSRRGMAPPKTKFEFSQAQTNLNTLMALAERLAANTRLLQQQMKRALQVTSAVAKERAQVREQAKLTAKNTNGLYAEIEQTVGGGAGKMARRPASNTG